MATQCIAVSVQAIRSIEAHQFHRATVEVEMTDAQVFEAIDELLDAGGPEKPAQRLAQLAENELTGMHA